MNRVTRITHEGWRTVRHMYSASSYRRAQRTGQPVSLTAIMNRQGSDKGTLHGYRAGFSVGHNYTAVYDQLFGSRRNDALTFLEVGIGPHEPGVLRGSPLTGGARGGSSAGWREYFPHGEIHAMDILECKELDQPRLTTHIGDQGDRESMQKVLSAIGKPLDVIIDDGSHQSGHQQITLATLFPALAAAGIYVIEDLDWQPLAQQHETPTTLSLLKEFQQTGAFNSPLLTDGERDMLASTMVVEAIHIGDVRWPGALTVLRKRTAEGK